MSSTPTNPPVSQLVTDVLNAAAARSEEPMALVGFVGNGATSNEIRLYPDIDFRRWMDIPLGEILHWVPLPNLNPGRLERTVVWVTSAWLRGPVFNPAAVINLNANFAGSAMSTWQFVPDTRLLAAQMLDLLPHLTYDKMD